MIRTLIVDDELLARQRIEDLLAKEPDIEIVGTASEGEEAIEAIQTLKPDLLFLDVQMPGRTGVEVLETIGEEAMPVTIFITAFDRFAIKAFDLAAADYLVKPFDDERFAQALRRARQLIPSPTKRYLQTFAVELRGQTRALPAAKVDYITASGPYAELHIGERTFTIREKMQTLEEQLDPDAFFRIHRSAIVRLDRVDALLHAPGGDYAVRLKDGTELSVSRTRRDELAGKLGM
ncbi:MAG TPA: LytTR family DNA-binding domain-containing protein [Thermoanaerobaculia bacterium]|nr:LytTR family DNA-binding domain-containing protein [Thermoanaerobaculia bacterium]